MRRVVFLVAVFFIFTSVVTSANAADLNEVERLYYARDIDGALQLLRPKAQVGNRTAQVWAGFILSHYTNIGDHWFRRWEPNRNEESLKWLKQAEENGSAYALFYLGLLHYGSECERYTLMKEAADKEVLLAKVYLDYRFDVYVETLGECGISLGSVPKKASHFRRLLARSSPDIKAEAARIILEPVEFSYMFEPVGNRYNRSYTDRTQKLALSWLRKAGSSGIFFAQRQLASKIFRRGEWKKENGGDFKQDFLRSIRVAETAIRSGSIVVAADLGCGYLPNPCLDGPKFIITGQNPLGELLDEAERARSGVKWLSVAVDRGMPVYHSLGWAYQNLAKFQPEFANDAYFWYLVSTKHSPHMEYEIYASSYDGEHSHETHTVRSNAEGRLEWLEEIFEFSEDEIVELKRKADDYVPPQTDQLPEHMQELPGKN